MKAAAKLPQKAYEHLIHKIARLESCLETKRHLLSLKESEMFRQALHIRTLERRIIALDNTVRVLNDRIVELQQAAGIEGHATTHR
jgi:hypothetical protein